MGGDAEIVRVAWKLPQVAAGSAWLIGTKAARAACPCLACEL
jgi:hypothetical protein